MNWYERTKIARNNNTRNRSRRAEEIEEDLVETDEEEADNKEASRRHYLAKRASLRGRRASRELKTASDIIRIRKRTTLDSVIGEYIGVIVDQVRKERPDLSGLEVTIRKANNLGFRLTKRSLDGTIDFYADCSFNLAPEHIKISITGLKDGNNFSGNLRLFLYDPLMKTSRRISGNIPSAE